jgi:uncharacterized protein (TIGR00369 family)
MLALPQLKRFLKTLPFNDLVGLRATAIDEEGVTLECPVRPHLLNAHRGLHGGVYGTIADAAVGMSIFCYFDGKRLATTVEMKVNYLLPIQKGKIVAKARLRRVGSSLAIGQVDLTDGQGRLAGIAVVTYKLLDPVK